MDTAAWAPQWRRAHNQALQMMREGTARNNGFKIPDRDIDGEIIFHDIVTERAEPTAPLSTNKRYLSLTVSYKPTDPATGPMTGMGGNQAASASPSPASYSHRSVEQTVKNPEAIVEGVQDSEHDEGSDSCPSHLSF